ncbi:hypothetical protein BaRGS_00008174 [Batillaria attramentaria]|uniref:Uncharacterized protein n=1 Tax=Batillaria attramentaria TaxID=370345 RepID=A0ABD0LLW9_9CAEN
MWFRLNVRFRTTDHVRTETPSHLLGTRRWLDSPQWTNRPGNHPTRANTFLKAASLTDSSGGHKITSQAHETKTVRFRITHFCCGRHKNSWASSGPVRSDRVAGSQSSSQVQFVRTRVAYPCAPKRSNIIRACAARERTDGRESACYARACEARSVLLVQHGPEQNEH